MKKILFIVVATMFVIAAACTAKAQEGGVKFQQGTLTELLAKAGAENKYLFVDIYTTWCPPCQRMASNVFPTKMVGDYMNATFVNAKFDAENGEGVDVAKKYNVKAYPTFVILNAEGKEVGRILGYRDGEDFVAELKKALTNVK